MGLPAKVLADGETALLVLRPHARRLVRPALVLLLLAPVAGYAAGAVPAGATQATLRAVVAAVAGIVGLRWVVWPFTVWWNTLYVLTDERLFERAGVARRTGHDLPLRGVTDVVVEQRLGERLLRSGTLSVTTEGGAQFRMTDVPGVSRLQHGLLAVADDVAERLATPRRFRGGPGPLGSAALGPAAGWALGEEELGGHYLEIGPGAGPDGVHDVEPDELDHVDDDRERERETARRLRALQEQMRRGPVPDPPVEDDAAPPPSADDSPEGARILPFPPRP
jgi:hypothetical protein